MNRAALFTALLTLPSLAWSQCPKSSDNCSTTTKRITPTGTQTSTRYDNHSHAEAAGEATGRATAAALQYFLVVRPAIETERQLRQNRAEGQFAGDYDLLDVLSMNELPAEPVALTTAPSIKGYALGETWDDFVQNSPMLKKRVDQCAGAKRPDSAKRRKRIDFNPCTVLWQMADDPKSRLTLDCLSYGMGAGKDMVCRDLNGEVGFDDGKLTSLKVVIDDDWKEVLSEATSKFGSPTGRDEADSLAIWSAPTYRVTATQVEEGSALAWMTPDRYQQAAEHGKQIIDAEVSHVGAGHGLDR